MFACPNRASAYQWPSKKTEAAGSSRFSFAIAAEKVTKKM